MSDIKIKPKYEIGTRIVDSYKDIILTDFVREPGRYAYRYICNKCGYDGSNVYYHDKLIRPVMTEKQIQGKKPCSICAGRLVSSSINSIAVLRPDIIKYFVNQDEPYKYRPQSNTRTKFKCPTCGKIYEYSIYNISIHGLNCKNCTDKKSLGERIMREILNSKGEDYIMEYTCTHAEWCKKYRYDFYICNYNTIVEIHGRQHYIDSPPYQSVKIQREIDKLKENLAYKNDIDHYIIIDAQKSNFDYIYDSFIKSPLFELLDLKYIDREKIKEKVLQTSTLVDICYYWSSHPNCSIPEMEKIFHLSGTTIREYLKQGNELSMCDFSANDKNHRYNPNKDDSHEYSHPIYCEELNAYFKSIGLCSKHSEELFGRHISDSTIREMLKDRRKSIRKIKYTFRYISKQEFNDAVNDDNITSYGSSFLKVS